MSILCTICLFALPYKPRKSLIGKKGIYVWKKAIQAVAYAKLIYEGVTIYIYV